MTELMELIKDCVNKLSKFRGYDKSGRRNRKSSDVKNIECFECHELGHLSYDCTKKAANKTNVQSQKSRNRDN